MKNGIIQIEALAASGLREYSMGAGSRFKIQYIPEILGLGLFIGKFPFALTISIHLIVIRIEIGVGTPYDKVK